MILLCCKEINPAKQKNKLMNKPLVDKKGKPKLQLKGRIFMSNVTETVSIAKPGSYTCQIFWKGDPGIENFVIRFSSEEVMKKWVAQVESQRRAWHESARQSGSSRHTGTSQTEFTYMQGHTPIENPYVDHNESDDEDTLVSANMYDPTGRAGSVVSGRSRSTTGDSGPPPAPTTRVPPPRFPMNYNQPPLTLRTQQLQHGIMPSPEPNNAESYFSPSLDSPMSSRTSSSSGMYPFPRQQTPSNGWYGEEHPRYTAPAMGRTTSREAGPAHYQPPRGSRPSLPAQNSQQYQNRMRSASSPDIQNPLNRRMPNGQPPVPDVPVPPFPTHYAYNSSIVNRSATSSPNQPPARAATQSPTIQRERLPHSHTAPTGYEIHADPRSIPRSSSAQQRVMPHGQVDYRTMTPVEPPRNGSPPMGVGSDAPIPTQLKVKVHCPSAGSTMTLVVSTNISFQSLKDRIDAKLQRSTNVSLASGQVRLKYLDEEDLVSIQSDEDVQTAFETWKEQQRDQMMAGSLGEIELFCQ
jgi:cell division control protein 24